jgi:hypothetical protein
MMAPEPDSAFAGGEIAAALRALHADSVRFWAAFSTADFLAPLGSAWSPAENVRHLTKSMRAVSAGLRIPRVVLWLRFGGGSGRSRTYMEVRESYRQRLSLGASAGRFAPEARRTAGDADAERARIMERHAAAVEEMAGIIPTWPEAALDRRRLPHPLLGPLTVREMLLFTLYHNRHHIDGVAKRLASAAG